MSPNRNRIRRLALLVSMTTAIFGMTVGRAGASGYSTDFEGFSTRTVNAQDGWSSLGAAGSGCAVYDHAIVDGVSVYGYAGFGDKALRISNAITSGCFSDQTFTESVADESGEATAASNGFSGGTRQPRFDASFDLASTVPSAEQSGLYMSVSPDRGDGARMSYLRFEDQSNGIHVFFDDYQDVTPLGSTAVLSDGCSGSDAFTDTDIATLDRSVPHNIRFSMRLIDGQGNDIVKIYIDGSLVQTGTSWEDYYRYCEATNTSRTVDSLLFRTGSNTNATFPGNAGKGFLVDNVVLNSLPPYTFQGFFSPVNNESVENIANAGQTIPLKFRVTDNGVPVTDLTSVDVTATSLSCAGLGTTADQIEEYASGGSGLINQGDGYYQFNWKTPKAYAKSCKTLSVDLGDGVDHTAIFRFTK